MAGRKNGQGSNASTAEGSEEKAARSLTPGVLVGRAADKLLKLEADERDALAKSPEQIKATFAKKRAEVLDGLPDETLRAGAVAMANAMRPNQASEAE